jgi:hypothetical protein
MATLHDEERTSVSDEDDTNKPLARTALGRFASGVSGRPTGRPRGSLNKWSREIVENAFLHFKEHPEALDRLYEENIVAYCKTIFELIPKDLKIQLVRPLESMSDAELAALAEQDHEASMKLINHVKEKVGSEIVDAAIREAMDGDDEDGRGS